MANFFDQAMDDAKNLEERLIGPSYPYYKQIYSPEELGMSSSGSLDALSHDISGMLGYVKILSSGGGPASKADGPLGNKFFLETGAKCLDTASNEKVTRSIYIDNVPDGSIPFVTAGTGVKSTQFLGLIPGTMSNLAKINPMQIFQSFMAGATPECQAVTLETIDVHNQKTLKTAYVTLTDLNALDAENFPLPPPSSKKTEGFKAYNDNSVKLNGDQVLFDYSQIPDDLFIRLYFWSLTFMGLFIVLLLMKGRRR
jgi:hypothetical protein